MAGESDMKSTTKLLICLSGLLILFVSLYFVGAWPFNQHGVIEGRVIIGPFHPVEPPSGSLVPPGTYSSRKIVLKPIFGSRILIPLNETGHFQANVRAGKYELDLTNCTYLGCEYALPVTVVIKPNQVTRTVIEIDTGIR